MASKLGLGPHQIPHGHGRFRRSYPNNGNISTDFVRYFFTITVQYKDILINASGAFTRTYCTQVLLNFWEAGAPGGIPSKRAINAYGFQSRLMVPNRAPLTYFKGAGHPSSDPNPPYRQRFWACFYNVIQTGPNQSAFSYIKTLTR